MKKPNKAQFDLIYREIKKKNGLTTSKLIEMAKDEGSPLHSLFEWRDDIAAQEYRKIQARNIIKSINVNIVEEGEKVVHIPSIKREEGTYKQAKVVVKTLSDFELSMDEALSKLRAAELAVKTLQTVAAESSPDSAAILAIALKGLSTASTALAKLH